MSGLNELIVKTHFRFQQVFLFAIFSWATIATAQSTTTQNVFLNFNGDSVRVGIHSPEDLKMDLPRGDILFFPGLGDRYDNHLPLFQKWGESGFRVVSFDYPLHGEAKNDTKSILEETSFADLANRAVRVEQLTFEGHRPLFLAGWSTGGLLAVRIAQSTYLNRFTRPIAGIALITPAVSIPWWPTNIGDNGHITAQTLTQNPSPPHVTAPHPSSILDIPLFALRILWNSLRANTVEYPVQLPTLALVAGDKEDTYVNSRGIKRWVRDQEKHQPAVEIWGIQCDGSYHEMDNEPSPVGPFVRQVTADFFISAIHNIYVEPILPEGCHTF